jgi:hypothetical protein
LKFFAKGFSWHPEGSGVVTDSSGSLLNVDFQKKTFDYISNQSIKKIYSLSFSPSGRFFLAITANQDILLLPSLN